MSSRARTFFHILSVSFAVAATSALGAAGAGAATVVNGDFETGNLSGWQVVNDPVAPEQTGDWYVYSGTTVPSREASVPPVPAGNYAAITAQGGPGTHILYQDVALEPFYHHQLSLIAYYDSNIPPVNPSPNSLLTEGEGGPENQQYRIDVIKPTASIFSLAPGDVLATVFATASGSSPAQLGATVYSADLSAFAGQTVRLRFAEADNRGNFYAGVDSVSILSTPPSNLTALGKPTLNKKKGTAQLPVAVPGAGTLVIADAKVKGKKRIKPKTVQALAAGTINLPVKPTKFARTTLKNKGKLKLNVAVTFTPTGGSAATQSRKVVLKLTPPQ